MSTNIMPGASTPVPTLDVLVRQRRFPENTGLRFLGTGVSLFPEGAFRAETVRIVEGCVCLYQPLADGRRQILDVLGPGRLMGPVLADLGRCDVMTLTRTCLKAIDPAREALCITEALQQSLRRSQAHALLLGRKTVTERIATALLDLAWQFSHGSPVRGGVTFSLYLTRADLADWLGLTLATVSRCLSALKRHGLIAYDHPKVVTILNREALEALALGAPAPADGGVPT